MKITIVTGLSAKGNMKIKMHSIVILKRQKARKLRAFCRYARRKILVSRNNINCNVMFHFFMKVNYSIESTNGFDFLNGDFFTIN